MLYLSTWDWSLGLDSQPVINEKVWKLLIFINLYTWKDQGGIYNESYCHDQQQMEVNN